jgi:transposase
MLLIVIQARPCGRTSQNRELSSSAAKPETRGLLGSRTAHRREGHRASSLGRRAFSIGLHSIGTLTREGAKWNVFCGIDWAEQHHDVALVDIAGQLVIKRRISDNVDGFIELLDILAGAGDSPDDPIPVAIETSRGPLVAALRATGREVSAINPMAVARYRKRHSMTRKKSDHLDAMTWANILRTDPGAHRPLPADTELAQAVTVLARAAQDAIWRRTKAT